MTYDGKLGRYAAIHEGRERGPKLYDLSTDPSELANLASKHPEIVERLATKIADWWPLTERRAHASANE